MRALAATLAAALVAGPAMADPLWDMCIGPGHLGPEQCDCITEGLRAELADPVLYEAVVARYLDNLGAGKAAADAWEMAVQRESAERQANYVTFAARIGQLADTHAAIRARCAGQ